MSASTLYIGIDVSKDAFDVATSPAHEAPQRLPHTDAGIATLVETLLAWAPTLIVLEATGGYETRLATALSLGGLPVAIVNPRQVRDFARALGQLAKTDTIDAAVLAEFAARMRPEPRPLPDDAHADLLALVGRRRQLLEMLTAERNRLALARPALRGNLQAHITWLEEQIAATDRDTRARLRRSPVWRARDALLQSVPGIGPQTAQRLIVSLPELGTLTARGAAKLVGLAPLNHDSGRYRGQRHIAGGRATVRSALYMATLVAIRHNPVIRTFYARLRAAGKAHRLALIAAMRKLLLILNTMVKQNTAWAPRHP